jgi:hypothetical protein
MFGFLNSKSLLEFCQLLQMQLFKVAEQFLVFVSLFLNLPLVPLILVVKELIPLIGLLLEVLAVLLV